jgi:hypothetical protein
MIAETRFNIGDRVLIEDLENRKGIVEEIRLCGRNAADVKYLVSYWWNGETREVWVRADEITEAN